LVAFGDVGRVECALGVDAADAVLFPSAAAFRHRYPALAGWWIYR
jgi:hypothetical protein